MRDLIGFVVIFVSIIALFLLNIANTPEIKSSTYSRNVVTSISSSEKESLREHPDDQRSIFRQLDQRFGQERLNTEYFSLLALDDEEVKVPINIEKNYCSMATWCPYSKQLKDFLNDPEIKRYLALRENEFVFVFENEWPRVRPMLLEADWTNDDIDSYIVGTGYSPVFDPSFLEDLPGMAYVLINNTDVEINGFPSFYDRSSKAFDVDRLTYSVSRLGLPLDKTITIMKKYAPKDE